MTKICHLTSVHKRYDSRIFRKECKSLSNAGYEVSLIVADNEGNEEVGGISIYDVGKEKARISRFVRTIKKIKKLALELNCDVYHFHDPELLMVGLKLKRCGKKVIWDMHENLPADIMQKKYIPFFLRLLITFIFKQFEKYTVKKVDAVICTRDSVIERLNGINQNMLLINNFPLVNYKIEKRETSERLICFAGAIVPNYQHKEIIQALEGLENVKYLMAGPANEKYLKELKALNGWNKVEYLGEISFEEVKQMYSKSNIGVVIHKYTPNMDWEMGNFALTKIFEVLLWGIPIVCTKYKLWEDTIFSRADCGIRIIPTDKNAIRNALKYLLNNPKEAINMGKVGRDIVLNYFNWTSQEEKLIDLYKKISS